MTTSGGCSVNTAWTRRGCGSDLRERRRHQGSVADRTIWTLHGLRVRDLRRRPGAGFAALGYLRNLPIDVLKVDRALVSRMPSERMDRAVVRAICDLASAAGALTVAEGVETPEVLAAVRNWDATWRRGTCSAGRPRWRSTRWHPRTTFPDTAPNLDACYFRYCI